MPDHRLPDAFDGVLAELFWDEVIPAATAHQKRMLAADGHRRLSERDEWLLEGGAIAGAFHAIVWLASHDMVKDYRPPTTDPKD